VEVIAAVRSLIVTAQLPGAGDDERCQECQLLGHCLPRIVSNPVAVDQHLREVVGCA
jgi:hypothetical protein